MFRKYTNGREKMLIAILHYECFFLQVTVNLLLFMTVCECVEVSTLDGILRNFEMLWTSFQHSINTVNGKSGTNQCDRQMNMFNTKMILQEHKITRSNQMPQERLLPQTIRRVHFWKASKFGFRKSYLICQT